MAGSPGRGPVAQPGLIVFAHAAPALLVWGLLGWMLSYVPTSWGLALAFGFCLLFGFSEVLDWRLRVPLPRWQVPSTWVRGTPRQQALIWGLILGPGLLTVNDFALMWLLPLLIVLCPPGLASDAGMRCIGK